MKLRIVYAVMKIGSDDKSVQFSVDDLTYNQSFALLMFAYRKFFRQKATRSLLYLQIAKFHFFGSKKRYVKENF